jgi:hypothetical protein
MMKIQ